MKKLIYGVLGLATAFILVSCGKSNNEEAVQAPLCGNAGYVFANGSCISAQSVVAPDQYGQCPVNYSLLNGMCYPIGGGIAGLGFYSDNYNGQTGMTKGGTTSGNTMFNTFMKEAMGVCDRTGNVGGSASCETYRTSADFDVIVQTPSAVSTSVQVTIRTGEPRNAFGGYGQWGYQLPSSWNELLWGIPSSRTYLGARIPTLALYMTVSTSNNSQGFTLRGYGNMATAANRGQIEIEVLNGKLDSPYGFQYKMRYKGEVIVQGQMNRCGSSDCRLGYPVGTRFY